MKPLTLQILLLCALGGLTFAQAPDPNALPQRTPKTPPVSTRPAELPEMPEDQVDETGEIKVMDSLAGVVIVDTLDKIDLEGIPRMDGLEIKGVPLLNEDDFFDVIRPYLGREVRIKTIRQLERDIITYCRSKNRPMVDVIVPSQSVESGTLQVWVLEGKVGRIPVENAGRRWFPDEEILKEVDLAPGDSVDSGQLLRDLDFLNRNPFRAVEVNFRQGTNFGRTDVVLKVEDRFPVRFYGGYENSGTQFTGEDRFLMGVNWGRAFGMSHQLNYQYTADIDFDLLSAHAISYEIPLPTRHTLTLFGAYVDATADFGSAGFTGTESSGKSYQASGRYTMPLPDLFKIRHQVAGGFDFKSTDNDFELGGTSEAGFVHIYQLILGYGGLWLDAWGQTSFGIETFFSPGDIDRDNDSGSFEGLREDTDSDYIYGRVSMERLTELPLNFSWINRGLYQFASDRLQPSEQFGAGGYRSVRGYSERLVNGDDGVLLSSEIRGPALDLGEMNGLPGEHMELQLLGFIDYAHVSNLDAVDGEDKNVDLLGIGAGFRVSLSQHVAFRFDYGWQMRERDLSSRNSQAHIGALVSF